MFRLHRVPRMLSVWRWCTQRRNCLSLMALRGGGGGLKTLAINHACTAALYIACTQVLYAEGGGTNRLVYRWYLVAAAAASKNAPTRPPEREKSSDQSVFPPRSFILFASIRTGKSLFEMFTRFILRDWTNIYYRKLDFSYQLHCSQELGDISRWIWSNKTEEAFDFASLLLFSFFFFFSFAFPMFSFNKKKVKCFLQISPNFSERYIWSFDKKKV